jgi:hypothetical protein
MFQFSQKLRDRLIKYLAEKKEINITYEQADEYLDSMADLYQCFLNMAKK